MATTEAVVIYCKDCGARFFGAMRDSETLKDSADSIAAYIARGDRMEIMDTSVEQVGLQKCTCGEMCAARAAAERTIERGAGMSETTKGPWEYVGAYVRSESGTVCDVRYKNGETDGPVLAAAPDLLSACEAGDVAACAWSEYMFSREIPSNEEETRRLYQAWMLARVKANHARKVAIAKSRGES